MLFSRLEHGGVLLRWLLKPLSLRISADRGVGSPISFMLGNHKSATIQELCNKFMAA